MQLTRAKAAEFLSAGPADASALLAHACGISTMPALVAEHMAVALFSGHPEFARDTITGRWKLVDVGTPFAVHGASDLAGLSYAVVDLETTGGRAQGGDRVTEVGIVIVRDGAIQETFETLVNPQRSIPPFVSALTNITWDMVRDKPVFADICADVVRSLGGHVFVAHNANFDFRFLATEIARAGGRRLDAPRLCTVRLARRVLSHLPRRSLDHVARYYGVEIINRHRALGDALATAKCLVRLLRDANCATWGEIQRLLATPSVARRRRRSALALPAPVTHDTTA